MKGWFAFLLAMMGASAFADKRSGDYWYSLDEAGNATITHWDGVDTDLTIPSKLDGHPVTAIGDCACQRGKVAELNSVVIPEGVTIVEELAFDGQARMQRVGDLQVK